MDEIHFSRTCKVIVFTICMANLWYTIFHICHDNKLPPTCTKFYVYLFLHRKIYSSTTTNGLAEGIPFSFCLNAKETWIMFCFPSRNNNSSPWNVIFQLEILWSSQNSLVLSQHRFQAVCWLDMNIDKKLNSSCNNWVKFTFCRLLHHWWRFN